MTPEVKFERLLAAISRRARAQEREGRIRPPRITARRRGPTRAEMQQAMAIADAVLLAYGHKLSPMARGALTDAQTRRTPVGDFSYRTPTPPTAEGLALVEQLRMGQLMREHRQHPFRGPQASYEPSGLKENAASWLGLAGAAGLTSLGILGYASGVPVKLAGRVQEADVRRQLLALTYVPSPPDPARYPWTLLSAAEVEDVKRRLYGPGGLVGQRMAAGY
jgi:hypothetical protein